MRKAFSIPLLVVALASLALGQAKNNVERSAAEVEQEILRLESEWMGAVVRRDDKVLDQLVADDFLLVSERWDGTRELTPKQPWIRNSLTTIEAKSFSYDKVRIQVRENMVVLHGLFTYEATNNGKPWGGTVRVTDVWVKEGGRWRVLARHASRPLQPQ
ncbi:MAG TPA: nuclear transport factor 2 family protein [Bacteroidota bacterium]|nr:nuclear transport factor 2 family protein [Bacteroidota bacterium]